MFRGRAESHATENVDRVSVYFRSLRCLGEELKATQQRTLIVFQCTLDTAVFRGRAESHATENVDRVSVYFRSLCRWTAVYRGKSYLVCRRISEYISLELFFSVLGKSWKPRNRKCCSCFRVDTMQ